MLPEGNDYSCEYLTIRGGPIVGLQAVADQSPQPFFDSPQVSGLTYKCRVMDLGYARKKVGPMATKRVEQGFILAQ